MHIVVKATFKRNGLDRKIEQAIARGINEGGDKVRTTTQRLLKTRTNVKAYKSITSRSKDSGRGGNRAAPGRLVYAIVATGKGIPIKEFPVSVGKGKGGAVDAKTWGVDHVFKRSFVENGKFKARRGKARFPIRSLYGPALPKELMSAEVIGVFRAEVALVVPPLVMKHLAKALS